MKKVSTQALALLLAMMMVCAVFTGCATQTAEQVQSATAAQSFSKTITVEVIHGDGTSKEFEIGTDAESLREALDEQHLIEGTESQYGLFVTTVDGETADDSQRQWWAITQDGEMTDAVDQVKIADGDHYEFTLSVY